MVGLNEGEEMVLENIFGPDCTEDEEDEEDDEADVYECSSRSIFHEDDNEYNYNGIFEVTGRKRHGILEEVKNIGWDLISQRPGMK